MPDGRVLLGDIDHYTRLKPGQKREKLDRHIEVIVEQWQAQTGKTFPTEEIASLKAFAVDGR